MTRYDSSRDEIITLGGRVISVQRAEHLVSQLESAIDKAHEYRENEKLHDINLNEHALNHLLDPTEKDYRLTVEIGHEEEANIATNHLMEILSQSDSRGYIEAHICASNISTFFTESDGIQMFHVKVP